MKPTKLASGVKAVNLIIRILGSFLPITFFHHDHIQYYIVLVSFYNLFPPIQGNGISGIVVPVL